MSLTGLAWIGDVSTMVVLYPEVLIDCIVLPIGRVGDVEAEQE